jgi:hypothetical protein
MLPTVEEFLCYVPRRLEFPWTVNENGIVSITVPKFTGKIGKSFCKILKRDNVFTANLDKLGSVIWQQIDGAHTVKDILAIIQKEFPGEKDIDQRLFLFLQQLKALCYLTY